MHTEMEPTEATRGQGAHGARARSGLLAAIVMLGGVIGATPRAAAQETVPPPPAGQVQVQAPQPQPQVVIVPVQPQPPPGTVYVQQPQGYVVAQPGYAPVAQPAPRRSRGGHVPLIVGGAVMLGAGWILNFVVGLGGGDDPFIDDAEPEWEAFRYSSFTPIVGPWVQLAVKPTAFTQDYWAVWLILDGLLQAAGTAMLVAGIAMSGDDGGEMAAAGGLELMVMPMAGPGSAGLAAVGRF